MRRRRISPCSRPASFRCGWRSWEFRDIRARVRFGVVMLVCLAGCGFERALPDDGGVDDLGSVDLVGLDLTGVDLTGFGADMTVTGETGKGPLGALPAGYCCASDEDCRSRACVHINGATSPTMCTDECDHDSSCSAWGGALKCQSGGGYCLAVDPTTFTCLDPSTFVHGTKATGSCCSSGFDKAGEECLGGICNATGPESNPFFCTQGCGGATGCPPGFTCNSLHWCWKDDPQAPYTCSP